MRQGTLGEIDIAVLAGGLGTRVAGLLGDRPKVLAPVAGATFLDRLLRHLAEQGARRVVLCLGYRATAVLDYLKLNPSPVEVVTSVEPSPLGTAGAVSFAMPVLSSDPVLVMNGDTFVEADLAAFLDAHLAAGTDASILCVRVPDPARYGRLEIDVDDRIVRFEEKNASLLVPSWINAGIYLFRRPLLARLATLKSGSLERDVLASVPPRSIHGWRSEGWFIDIGTPESLAMASGRFSAPHRSEEDRPQ